MSVDSASLITARTPGLAAERMEASYRNNYRAKSLYQPRSYQIEHLASEGAIF
jgi:hypothetical protein